MIVATAVVQVSMNLNQKDQADVQAANTQWLFSEEGGDEAASGKRGVNEGKYHTTKLITLIDANTPTLRW